MKGAPKQVENVALRLGDAELGAGDLRGIAREEVIHRLLRRQRAIGGSTPNASAVSMMTFSGCGATPSMSALGMNSSG